MAVMNNPVGAFSPSLATMQGFRLLVSGFRGLHWISIISFCSFEVNFVADGGF